jgi:hypothetical protein
MSVRREAANVLPIIAGIRDSAVQLVSILGSVVMSVWGMGMVKVPVRSVLGVIYSGLDGSRACSPCVGSAVAESPPTCVPNACRRRFGKQRRLAYDGIRKGASCVSRLPLATHDTGRDIARQVSEGAKRQGPLRAELRSGARQCSSRSRINRRPGILQFKFQSSLVWDSIKPVSNFAFDFDKSQCLIMNNQSIL